VNEAAAAHSAAVGLGLEEYRALGILWVVRKHEIEYLAEARLGDAIEAATWVDSAKAATTLRRTSFRRAGSDRELARAATTWALLSIATGRPTRIPRPVLARYGFGPAETG
jgi:acyl-CoA thioester hydrolase